MTLDLQKPFDRKSTGAVGADIKRVFASEKVSDGRVVTPSSFHALPDFRPSSEKAFEDALQGIAPASTQLSKFNPVSGPFSLEAAAFDSWAQSLDFLRDIKAANIGSSKLSHTWVQGWLAVAGDHAEKLTSLFAATHPNSSKTDRLIWRSRRILNCLSHVLPILAKLDQQTTEAFWRALMSDIAKIGAPTDTLWASLKDGFDPLSPRAIWLRAVALLGVEAALPGLLRVELVEKSLDHIRASIQSDGMFMGGSVIGTLSAGADLCMLPRIAAIEPILHRVRNALASLRTSDGTLVTFGLSGGDYAQLLGAIIGPGYDKPSALLLESGIARMSAEDIIIWMRTPTSGQIWGATCAVDVAGGALLTNFGTGNSGVAYNAPARISQARCKRRDEQDSMMVEVSATLTFATTISSKNYHSLRQIRLARDGTRIEGEDTVRPDPSAGQSGAHDAVVKELCFGVPQTNKVFLSKDKQSVLIVTSRQQAWRFRIQGMDICVEMRSSTERRNMRRLPEHIIVCRCLDLQRSIDFRTTWQFALEDIE